MSPRKPQEEFATTLFDIVARVKALEVASQLSNSTVGDDSDTAAAVDDVVSDAVVSNAAIPQMQDDAADGNQGVTDLQALLASSDALLDARLSDAAQDLSDARDQLAQSQQDISDAFGQRVDGLSDDVDTAITAAGGAASAAAAAQSTADKAVSDAAAANSLASTAKQAAADANTAALSAAGIANGKGKLIVQGSAPTGANAVPENLWFDISTDSNGKPKNQANRYDTSTSKWVPITDQKVTDAAAAAAAAQSAASSAASAAAAADTKAANAQTTANNAGQAAAAAQTTADTAKTNAAAAQAQADTARTNAAAAQARADLAAFATFSSERDAGKPNDWLRATYPVVTTAGTVPSYALILAAAPTASTYVDDGATLATGLGDQYIGLLRTIVQVTAAKTFTVNLQHDDGAQFYVDGVSVYSRGTSSGSVIAVSFTLSAGWHVLDLLWAEQAGGDGIYNVSPTFTSQVSAMFAPVSLQSRAADAAQALTNAQTAQTAANTAKSAADTAQAAANAAQTTANNAGQAAAAAQTTADQAKTNAATAQSAADTAKAAADTAAAKAVAIAGGVLVNGGAEFDFDSWDASSKGTIAVQTTKVRSGSKAWQATTSGEIRQGMFPVKPGDTWRFRWWAQAVNTGTGSVTGGLRLQKYDATASSPGWTDAASSTTPVASVFTMQEVTFTVPSSGVTHLRARIAFANAAGVTVYFDDIELVNITDAKAAADAASNAQSAATIAQSTADQAKTNAATAQSAADAAKTAAAAAQSTADTAKANAATAQTAANAAQSTADTAKTNAATAQSKADQASSDAATAAGIAGGKADVLIQSATPAASFQKATTLWIDTTSSLNSPKRWSGSAWVVVTDKAATDAASAAATANSAAATAKTAADNAAAAASKAQQDATAAANAASAAQATADGKPLILFSSSAGPSGTAPTGSIWFLWDSSKNVAGQWLQSGTLASPVWTPQQIKSEVIANLDVAKLTAGSAAIADLVAQKIAASTANFQTANVSNLFVTSGATMSQAVIDFLFANVVQAKKITAGMIDATTFNGVLFTGATFQTAASGTRVKIDSGTSGGAISFFGSATDPLVSMMAVLSGSSVDSNVPGFASVGGGLQFASGSASPVVFVGQSVGAVTKSGVSGDQGSFVDFIARRALFGRIFTAELRDPTTGVQLVGDTGWVYPALNAGTNDSSDPFRVRRLNGVVHFGGLITPTAANQTAISALAAQFRPMASLGAYLNRGGTSSTAGQWLVRVGASGNVVLVGGGNSPGGTGNIDMAGFPPFPAAQ
ncbi:hypothetical protein ACWGJ9_07440 [Curtobacterium citreum]